MANFGGLSTRRYLQVSQALFGAETNMWPSVMQESFLLQRMGSSGHQEIQGQTKICKALRSGMAFLSRSGVTKITALFWHLATGSVGRQAWVIMAVPL